MSGRFHYYEGYDYEQLVAPVRLFKLLGVENMILTQMRLEESIRDTSQGI